MRSLLTILLLSLFAQIVHAEDEFTFTVPVSISNVEFRSGAVECAVYATDDEALHYSLGHGRSNFYVRNPPALSLSRTVTVTVSTEAAHEVGRYRCHVSIELLNGETITSSGEDELFIDRYQRSTGKQLEEVRAVESGTI